MAIDFTKLKPIEEEQEIDSNTSENTGIDFSSLSPVDYDDSPTITPESGYIPTDITKQYNPETYKAPIRMLDNYTLSEDKMNVIESKYNNSVLQIEKARKNLDNLNLTQDEKDLISGRYDLALDKLKVERIDSIRKEQNEMLKIDKMKGYTPSLSLEERLPQQGEAFVGGFNRMTLGIARLATAPFPDTDGKSQIEEAIVNNQKAIDEALDKAGIPKDQAITPDLAGEIVANVLPASLISKGAQLTKTGISVVEGIIAAIQKYGSTTKEKDKVTGEDTYKPTTELEATTTGLIAGTTSKVGLELVDRLVKDLGDISYTARKMIERVGGDKDEITNILKGVPKDKQAETLANALPQFAGEYKGALQYSNKVRVDLANKLTDRAKEFDNAIGKNNFLDMKYAAENMWKDMAKAIDDEGLKIDVTDLTNGLDRLRGVGGTSDAMITKIDNLKSMTEQIKTMDGTQVLELRTKVNDLLSSYKGKDATAYGLAKDLKDNIDNKIKSTFPEDTHKFLDDTLQKYGVYKEQEKVFNVLEANKVSRGTGTAKEQYTYDYENIAKQLDEEGLLTSEAKQSLNLIQQMNYKFGSDFKMFASTDTAMTGERGGVLGLFGALVNTIKVPVAKITNTEVGINFKIQSEIRKSIQKSDNTLDFIKSIAVNKDLPKEFKQTVIDNLTEINKRREEVKNISKFIDKQETK